MEVAEGVAVVPERCSEELCVLEVEDVVIEAEVDCGVVLSEVKEVLSKDVEVLDRGEKVPVLV
jgi:hypothetical protein